VRFWPTRGRRDDSPDRFEHEVELSLDQKLWANDESVISLLDLMVIDNAVTNFPVSQDCIDRMHVSVYRYAWEFHGKHWAATESSSPDEREKL
jgi:hypothetical protein